MSYFLRQYNHFPFNVDLKMHLEAIILFIYYSHTQIPMCMHAEQTVESRHLREIEFGTISDYISADKAQIRIRHVNFTSNKYVLGSSNINLEKT